MAKKKISWTGILGMRVPVFITLVVLLGMASVEVCFGQDKKEESGVLALKNFSATAAITSDYVFRGLSQTDEDPAVQASFEYKHPVGFYAGVWGSSVDESISEGNVELDLYAGFKREVAENLTFDLSVIYYWYPGDGREPEKTQGAYWATTARINTFNKDHFCTEVAAMAQLTGELMKAELK